jgi:hypothetical protein
MPAPSFVPSAVPPRNPTLVTGMRDPSQLTAQRIVPDVSDKIAFVRPSANPLCVVTMGIKKLSLLPATQRQFDWLEKDPLPDTVRVNGAQIAGDTSVEIATGTGTYAKQFDLWMNTRTLEVIYITSAVTTDTWTVTRNVDGAHSAAMVDQDVLLKVGNTYEDGSGVGQIRSVKEARLYNYCSIIRTAFAFTRREATMKLYGGDDVDTEEQAQAVEHATVIEKMAWFGQRFSTTGSNSREVTSSQGILNFIQTNIWNLATAEGGQIPTESQLVGAVEQGMYFGKNGSVGGGGDKLLFASRNWMTFFDKIARDRIRYVDMGELLGKGRIGLTVGEFHTVHGRLVLVSHPLFPLDLAAMIDPAHVWMRYHQGGNGFPDGRTRVRRGIQSPDVDGVTNEFLSDLGVMVQLEMAHMVWRGLPAVA